MDLTINKTRGLIDLIEFRTNEKNDVFFDNNFGMIKGNKLIFHKTSMTYMMNEIVTIELIKRKSKYANATLYIGIVLLTFLFLEIKNGLLIAIVILCLVLLFFKKIKVNFLEIDFCNEEPKYMMIEECELSDVTSFLKAYKKYKS